jgi:hypothetical protein
MSHIPLRFDGFILSSSHLSILLLSFSLLSIPHLSVSLLSICAAYERLLLQLLSDKEELALMNLTLLKEKPHLCRHVKRETNQHYCHNMTHVFAP